MIDVRGSLAEHRKRVDAQEKQYAQEQAVKLIPVLVDMGYVVFAPGEYKGKKVKIDLEPEYTI